MGSLLSTTSARDDMMSFGDINETNTLPVSPTEPPTQPTHITPYTPPRYHCNDPSFIDYLHEYGYVVIQNVITDEEIVDARELCWKFLEKDAGMFSDDISTWNNSNFGKIGSSATGIIFYGINQSDFLWFLRLLKPVKTAFSTIFGDDNLLTSFDGGNIFRPWHSKSANGMWKTSSGWFHVDQGRTLRGLQCVQGLVTLYDATEATGGFCAIPKSHLCHDELVNEAASNDKNFVRVPHDFAALNGPQHLITCKAGDMILWDSRTIHCNTPAITPPTTPENELLRMVGYVCMTPSSKASKEVIENRIAIYERGLGTTHWPHISTYTANKDDPPVRSIDDAPADVRSLVIGKS
mmetsp:Transcript_5229/g.8056  ORF Transcript_5229/g.8056 Transcript_5229/m.8056 type:complete len:351 (-) Transcript_5229:175-1227(-)|eukprot:CAMPEP_0185018164 /NCGR_PEP_ID=MMETSP1103-20130426/980_1 /TAXON_ID=36769 /ORGANISM="Paraphysomonas bandaiensis, Strain Caron Lab Isolate" /LENGTH=350 /DNA_ID=CAMNT_0027547885 /DNA_START=43 /DNA_END=1095 /DNA_ORIENTATION=+